MSRCKYDNFHMPPHERSCFCRQKIIINHYFRIVGILRVHFVNAIPEICRLFSIIGVDEDFCPRSYWWWLAYENEYLREPKIKTIDYYRAGFEKTKRNQTSTISNLVAVATVTRTLVAVIVVFNRGNPTRASRLNLACMTAEATIQPQWVYWLSGSIFCRPIGLLRPEFYLPCGLGDTHVLITVVVKVE